MSTIIDELVLLMKLDAAPVVKGAAEAEKAIDSVKTKAKVSEADQERIERSREISRQDRAKKEAKQKPTPRNSINSEPSTVRNKSPNSATRLKVSQAPRSASKTVKGLVGYLSNLSTATAALGRDSANLGTSSDALQTWANAIKRAGGNAEDAKSSFAAVSQSITAFTLKGETSPLIALAQRAGATIYNADGSTKDASTLLPEIYDKLKAQGLNRQNLYNLLGGAGVSEGALNLLADPNRSGFLAAGAQDFIQ